MLKKLYRSQLLDKESQLAEMTLWLPFVPSKTGAWKLFLQRLSLDEETYFCYGYWEEQELLAIVDGYWKEDCCVISGCFVLKNRFSWSAFFYLCTATARRKRSLKIKLTLPKPLLIETTIFQDYGYSVTEEETVVHFTKGLTYHTGLVLGGGGAKGSYQVGAWKALRELKITPTAVSGTSVGALNGGLVVQNEFEAAKEMWETIQTKDILNLPQDTPFETYEANEWLQHARLLTRSALRSVGIDTTPLKELISKKLSPAKLVASPIDFYLVTTNALGFSEVVINKKEVSEEELPQWFLASASFFPAMAACKINGDYYIDGGYRNNVPQDVLEKPDITDLIVIDVSGPGFNKNIKPILAYPIIHLKSKWGLGSVLLFETERAKWNMELGYLEMMKALGYLEGERYSFLPNNFKITLKQWQTKFLVFLKQMLPHIGWTEQEFKHKLVIELTKQDIVMERFVLCLLEKIADYCQLEPTKEYTIEKMMALCMVYLDKQEKPKVKRLKSMGEWIDQYLQESRIRTQQHFFWETFDALSNQEEVKEDLQELFNYSMPLGLEVLFLIYIEGCLKNNGR